MLFFNFSISALFTHPRAPYTIHFHLYISMFIHDLSILQYIYKYSCYDLIPSPRISKKTNIIGYLPSKNEEAVENQRGHFLFAFVLMGWSLLPNALRPFRVYCAPPNLGITKTWIRGLNFALRPIFSDLRFFNESEISDWGSPAYIPSRRTCAQDFYVLKKSIDLSRIWTCAPWISRRACYPETTEADKEDIPWILFFKIESGHVARMEEGRSTFKMLTGAPTGKRPLGRPRRRW